MTYLFVVLVSAALLGSFLALLGWEGRRGARVLSERRAVLDARVSSVALLFTRTDFGTFLEAELRAFGGWLLHEVVRLSLLAVRAIERLLTRFVKYLRTRASATAPAGETTRDFVKTLSGFKQELRASTPPIAPQAM